jgi:hypothetical protein
LNDKKIWKDNDNFDHFIDIEQINGSSSDDYFYYDERFDIDGNGGSDILDFRFITQNISVDFNLQEIN